MGAAALGAVLIVATNEAWLSAVSAFSRATSTTALNLAGIRVDNATAALPIGPAVLAGGLAAAVAVPMIYAALRRRDNGLPWWYSREELVDRVLRENAELARELGLDPDDVLEIDLEHALRRRPRPIVVFVPTPGGGVLTGMF